MGGRLAGVRIYRTNYGAPIIHTSLNPGPPLRSDLGLRIWRAVAGLSLTELFDRIADEYPKRSKMTTEGGLLWKAEQEAVPVIKIMDVALKSVI